MLTHDVIGQQDGNIQLTRLVTILIDDPDLIWMDHILEGTAYLSGRSRCVSVSIVDLTRIIVLIYLAIGLKSKLKGSIQIGSL